ncbi:MAG: hypothetical protein A3E85_03825 [Gammaproteobacteria bacterium RIFCSPHIGHO2_12_FULL_45_12]|nr:MAG: hypothetical protein A3E85_03825 [Gammaproteobacteria bacterium RIFCSPHIGHO2_12_FULL_45_12]
MMRSMKQEQLKYDLHNELQIRHREFFESKLAIDLLKHNKQFSSVNKISSAIVKLIESNKKAVMDLITSNPNIITELREPYFGSCYDSKQETNPAEVLEKICSILNNENADVRNAMQIHCIFIHRIYDHLEKRSEKTEFVSKLFPSSLFSKENRSRVEIKEDNIKSTTQLGISRHPVFIKMLEKSDKNHTRAMEKYTPDYKTTFFKSALEKNIPIVCGPSGHTGSLMLGAKLYGDLTSEQLKEYALVSFAFLAAGGNHSFHEVMVVAALVGVDFQVGNYAESIPLSIKKSGMYQKLSNHFSEFLDADISSENNPIQSPLTCSL